MADDETPGKPPRTSPRSPLLDPRLAGAGGMLIAAAAIAWMVTQGTHHDPVPAPASSPTASVSR